MDYKLACEYRDGAPYGTVAYRARSGDGIDSQMRWRHQPSRSLSRFSGRPLSLDANDDMVLDVAINGNADAIVTNNTKHFREAAESFHLEVLTPAGAIEQSPKEEIESMPVSQKKVLVSKFPLRLMPSVRRVAENFSQKEGVSLNQFINIAVAEKPAHLQHEGMVVGTAAQSKCCFNCRGARRS